MKKYGIAAYGGLISFRGKYCFKAEELSDPDFIKFVKEDGADIVELDEETIKDLER